MFQQNTVFNAAFSSVMFEECPSRCKVPENFMICPDPLSLKLMQIHNMTDKEAISCPISDQQPKGGGVGVGVGAAVRQGDSCNYAAFPWLTTRWQYRPVKMDRQFLKHQQMKEQHMWMEARVLKDQMIEHADCRNEE